MATFFFSNLISLNSSAQRDAVDQINIRLDVPLL